MLNLVIGLGVQGSKRIKFLKENYITVDPIKRAADYKKISQVPLDTVTHAYVCTPEEQKFEIIEKLLKQKIHVLVEKPIIFKTKEEQKILEILKNKKSTLYTAYNHRFEPNIVKAKHILDKKKLGEIYYVNLYYGNGTAQLWKNNWREKNKYSIIQDLGVHLLDIFDFWFEFYPNKFDTNFRKKNELKCFDFFSFSSKEKFLCNFSTSIINWRNTFKADIIGSKGSLHIDSLCKWGPSTLTLRKRKFPSGKPLENIKIIKKDDPTWELEERFFKNYSRKNYTNFKNDLLIKKCIDNIK